MDTRHLKQRGRSWYVQKRVPKDLQTTLGKKVVVQSLQTRDLKEAQDRRWAALADIQAKFDRARTGAVLSPLEIERAARTLYKDMLFRAVHQGEALWPGAPHEPD